MLVMSMLPAVLLVTLKPCTALCVPTVPEVNARLIGRVVTGAAAVPPRPTNASRSLLLS